MIFETVISTNRVFSVLHSLPTAFALSAYCILSRVASTNTIRSGAFFSASQRESIVHLSIRDTHGTTSGVVISRRCAHVALSAAMQWRVYTYWRLQRDIMRRGSRNKGLSLKEERNNPKLLTVLLLVANSFTVVMYKFHFLLSKHIFYFSQKAPSYCKTKIVLNSTIEFSRNLIN